MALAVLSPTAFITSIRIVAGQSGTDVIPVMLVLAAHIPLIDGTIGHDRAIGVHRSLSKPAFYLLLGHGVLRLIGYGMSHGFGAIAVVVTSLVAVRREFSYESWHVVHLLSSVSVAGVATIAPGVLSIHLPGRNLRDLGTECERVLGAVQQQRCAHRAPRGFRLPVDEGVACRKSFLHDRGLPGIDAVGPRGGRILMQHVFETMGTVASIALPDTFTTELDAVCEIPTTTDQRFRLYLPESELSRIASGLHTLGGVSSVVRDR